MPYCMLTRELADFHLIMSSSSNCLPFQKISINETQCMESVERDATQSCVQVAKLKKIHGYSDFKIYGHMICRLRIIMKVSCCC